MPVKIGRGIDFPFEFDPTTGGVRNRATQDNIQRIKQSIRLIITTNRGERFFRPNFGTIIKQALFEPLDPATISFIEYELNKTLYENEPRIVVMGVQVFPDESESLASATIFFRLRDDIVTESVVVPLIPQDNTYRVLPPTHDRGALWE